METFAFRRWTVEVRRKAFRRRLSVVLKPGRPILVNVARLTSEREIVFFLKSRESWIEGHMLEFARQERELPPRRLSEGAQYPFLGKNHVLRAVPTPLKRLFISRQGNELLLHLPSILYAERGEDLSFARAALREFYKNAAEKYLPERLREWSEKTGLKPAKVRINETRTRWGSCSPERVIALNWRLMIYSPEIIDSVIVHEVAHLEHMNHSKKFWARVIEILPESLSLTKELRRKHRLGEFLDRA